jgi:hypothetical protein
MGAGQALRLSSILLSIAGLPQSESDDVLAAPKAMIRISPPAVAMFSPSPAEPHDLLMDADASGLCSDA